MSVFTYVFTQENNASYDVLISPSATAIYDFLFDNLTGSFKADLKVKYGCPEKQCKRMQINPMHSV